RGEDAWQAARRRVADRNARVRKLGKQQRREHEERIAAYRRADDDPRGPPAPAVLRALRVPQLRSVRLVLGRRSGSLVAAGAFRRRHLPTERLLLSPRVGPVAVELLFRARNALPLTRL